MATITPPCQAGRTELCLCVHNGRGVKETKYAAGGGEKYKIRQQMSKRLNRRVVTCRAGNQSYTIYIQRQASYEKNKTTLSWLWSDFLWSNNLMFVSSWIRGQNEFIWVVMSIWMFILAIGSRVLVTKPTANICWSITKEKIEGGHKELWRHTSSVVLRESLCPETASYGFFPWLGHTKDCKSGTHCLDFGV